MGRRLTTLTRWLPAALAAGAVGTFAAAQDKKDAPQPAPAPAQSKTEHTVTFSFQDKKWSEVIDWFKTESGLVFAGTNTPTGTITVRPNPGKKYTIPEVIDLLNELLQPKWVLIRREQTFTIWPADEPIESSDVARITEEELAKRGKTEVVQLVVSLGALNADETVPQLKVMLSSFGKISPLGGNSVIVQDKAGNVRRVKKEINELTEERNQLDKLAYQCKFVKAATAAETLRTLLAGDGTTVDLSSNAAAMGFLSGGFNQFGGDFGSSGGFGSRGRGFDRGSGGFDRGSGFDRGGFDRGGFSGGSGFPSVGSSSGGGSGGGSRFKSVRISVQEQSNTILITGPVDKITVAKKFLTEDIDKGTAPYVIGGDPSFRTYAVALGTAQAVAQTLSTAFKNSSVAVVAIGQDRIMVYGYPADHLIVAKQLKSDAGDTGGLAMVTKIVPVVSSDAKNLAATLTKMFPSNNGLPIIEPQNEGLNTGILVRGNAQQVEDIEKQIRLIDGSDGIGAGGAATPQTGNRRVIPLEKGSAGILAESLSDYVRATGKNDVLIIDPTAPPSKPKAPTNPPRYREKPKDEPPAAPPMPPPTAPAPQRKSSRLAPKTGDRMYTAYTSYTYADPQDGKKLDTQPPPQKGPPVLFGVAGNKLIIECDDPQMLGRISELARICVNSQGTEGQDIFKVIRLKNVSADDAARAISEVFNGPPQQGGGGGGGRGGGGGFNPLQLLGGLMGGGASAPSGATPGRVRVVADKFSNSLIVVKASPLDYMIMRKLLEKAFDTDELLDSDAVAKVWVIPCFYASAADIATTIQQVFRQQTGRGAGFGGGGAAMAGNPLAAMAALQGGGGGGGQGATSPALAIGVHDMNNSIVVQCNAKLYDDILTLVEELDESAKDQKEVVRVLQITGVDPSLLADAINAMQGQPMTGNRGRGGLGGGGFGGGGLGGGGFTGGGGFGGGGLGGGGLGGGGFQGGGGRGAGGFGGGGQGGGGFGGGGRGAGGFGGGGQGGGGFGGGGRGGGGAAGGGGRGGGGRGGERFDPPNDPRFQGRAGDPSNFDYRDTDVPSALGNFADPEQTQQYTQAGGGNPAAGYDPYVQQTQGTQVPPGTKPLPGSNLSDPNDPRTQTQPRPMGATGQPPIAQPIGDTLNLTAPRSPVTVQAIPGLDVLILRAKNKEELQAIIDIVQAFKRSTENAEIEIERIQIENQDATALVNLLNQIFSRVSVTTGGNTLQQGRGGPAGGGFGAGLGGLLGGANQASIGQLFMYPLPRFNQIFLAAPKGRMQEVKKWIKEYDIPNNGSLSDPKPYQLKRASAQIVSQQIQNLFNARYPGETLQLNQIRVFADNVSNTVFVQASPADQRDIAAIIEFLDSTESRAVNRVKVIKLKYGFADAIAQTIGATFRVSFVQPTANQAGPATGAPGGGGGQFGIGGGGVGFQQQQGGLAGLLGGLQGGGLGGANQQVNQLAAGVTTKTTTLEYVGPGGKVYKSGLLEDVHMTPDTRINAIVVAAPEATMPLIEALIEQLDSVSAAQGSITVFQLKKADATATFNLLSTVFGQTTGAGAFGGGLGANLGGAAQAGGRPILSTGGDDVSPGVTLLTLRITPDVRTNSLVVAGARTDIETIAAIIGKLEATEVPNNLSHEVIKIRNASVADIATALTTFLNSQGTNTQNLIQTATSNLVTQLQYTIVSEPVTNQLIVAGTPQTMAKIRDLVAQLDVGPPQVYIQVLIAEVTLTNNNEFGIEVGLQTPLMFTRSLTGGTGTAAGTPGFNFNTTAALPNNSISPGATAFQGLGNLGVGRAGASGVGGFVFSAASDTVSVLIRALQVQGRAEIISAPQLLLMDNQVGYFQDGQDVPYLGGTTLGVGQTAQDVLYRATGVKLRVTPRISPDGKVLMRVEPEVSSLQPGSINLGNGITAPAFNLKTVQTTVQAADGETVVLGGLIRKADAKTENKIPWFGDLPYVGSLFRFRQHNQERRETIFIVTPHILRTEADKARVSAEMAAKLNYSIKEMNAIHGHGSDILSGQSPFAAAQQPWYPPQGGYYVPGFYYPQAGEPPAAAPAQPAAPAPAAGTPIPQPMTPQGHPQPMAPQGGVIPMPGGQHPTAAPQFVPQTTAPVGYAPPTVAPPAGGAPGLVPVGGYWYPAQPGPGPMTYVPGRPATPAPAAAAKPDAKTASPKNAMEGSTWSPFDLR